MGQYINYSVCKDIDTIRSFNLSILGIGDKSKLFGSFSHPHRLAYSIKNQGSLFRQTRSKSTSKGKFPVLYDMR